jgi:DNA repair photolyase
MTRDPNPSRGRSPPPKAAPAARIKGRGAASNSPGRFEPTAIAPEDDGWYHEDEDLPGRPKTTVTEERARSIVSRNDSPDIPFDQSLNPYRGCEHGCVYCYARPSHGYLNLSAGLDFETKLFAKTNAAERLRAELAKPNYACTPINLGANTDPYQPIERRYRLTRAVLELFVETRHPVTIVTKNALIERDLDLLVPLARQNLVYAFVSVTTLDNTLASRLEPRASAPHARLRAIRALSEAGVPVGVFVAPLIPMLTDAELEAVLERAREAGARSASYTLVRLPHEVKDLFKEWLALHYPERAEHVMSLIRQMRGGRENDPRFGSRFRGEGVFAQLIARRFRVAVQRLGYAGRNEDVVLERGKFVAPRAPSAQGELW